MYRKKVTGMQPRMMARQTRALSCVLPGGHTQNIARRMSSSVSCSGSTVQTSCYRALIFYDRKTSRTVLLRSSLPRSQVHACRHALLQHKP